MVFHQLTSIAIDIKNLFTDPMFVFIFKANEGKCKFEDWIVMCDKSILESKAAEEKKSDSQCNASSDVTSTSNVPHPQPVQPVPTPSVSKIKLVYYIALKKNTI